MICAVPHCNKLDSVLVLAWKRKEMTSIYRKKWDGVIDSISCEHLVWAPRFNAHHMNAHHDDSMRCEHHMAWSYVVSTSCRSTSYEHILYPHYLHAPDVNLHHVFCAYMMWARHGSTYILANHDVVILFLLCDDEKYLLLIVQCPVEVGGRIFDIDINLKIGRRYWCSL